MPNTLQYESRVSALSVEILARQLALPATVARQSFADFTGGGGDTVTVRVRQKLAAQKRLTAAGGDSITRGTIVETPVNVTLAEVYSAVPVTNFEWELELQDFGAQIIAPQMAGIAESAEDELIDVMNDLDADESFAMTASAEDTEDALIGASEALDLADVPMSNRYLAISPAIKSRMLKVPNFVRADGIGNGTAIERATFGDILGFTVVVSNGLDAGTAVAYHRSSFAFAAGARSVPDSVQGAVGSVADLALLWMRQWNPDTLNTESVGQLFAGAAAVDAGNRAYKLDTATS